MSRQRKAIARLGNREFHISIEGNHSVNEILESVVKMQERLNEAVPHGNTKRCFDPKLWMNAELIEVVAEISVYENGDIFENFPNVYQFGGIFISKDNPNNLEQERRTY